MLHYAVGLICIVQWTDCGIVSCAVILVSLIILYCMCDGVRLYCTVDRQCCQGFGAYDTQV